MWTTERKSAWTSCLVRYPENDSGYQWLWPDPEGATSQFLRERNSLLILLFTERIWKMERKCTQPSVINQICNECLEASGEIRPALCSRTSHIGRESDSWASCYHTICVCRVLSILAKRVAPFPGECQVGLHSGSGIWRRRKSSEETTGAEHPQTVLVVNNSKDSGGRMPGFTPCLGCLLVLWPWTSQLALQCLDFLKSKMGLITVYFMELVKTEWIKSSASIKH